MRQKYIKVAWEFIHKVTFHILLAHGVLPKRGNDALAAFSSFMAESFYYIKLSKKPFLCYTLDYYDEFMKPYITKDVVFAKDSIGYLNGFNRVRKPLPDNLDEITKIDTYQINFNQENTKKLFNYAKKNYRYFKRI